MNSFASAFLLVLMVGATACSSSTTTESGAARVKTARVDQTKRAFAVPVQAPKDKSADIKVGATLLSSGATVAGQLSQGSELLQDGTWFQRYRFRAAEGQSVTITMRSPDFDTYLLIQDGSSGSILAEDDDSGGDLDAQIRFTAPRTGDYFVLANQAERAAGRFSLSVQHQESAAAPTIGNGASIAAGDRIVGALTDQQPRLADGSPYAQYQFNATRGDRLRIQLASPNYDAYLILAIVQEGALVPLHQDDDSAGGTDARIDWVAPVTGPYVVIATTYNPTARGAFSLEILENAAAESAAVAPDGNWANLYSGSNTDPRGKYAVLVGIDDYPGEESDLGSCVADTRLMRAVLINQFGFRPENIVMIHDNAATREHIAAGIATHLSKAGPEGAAVFYFSGHGLRLSQNWGVQDIEPDDVDESLYVWGLEARSSLLLDDEIGALMEQLRAGRKLVVLDACHSGTGSKDLDWTWQPKEVQWNDPEVQKHLDMPETFFGTKKVTPAAAEKTSGYQPTDHVLLAACKSDQTAESRAGGLPTHGGVASTFTYYLVRELEEGPMTRPWSQIIEVVTARIKQDGLERGMDESEIQVPQAEGESVTRVGGTDYSR